MSKANAGRGRNTPPSWNSPLLLLIQNSPFAGSSGSLQSSGVRQGERNYRLEMRCEGSSVFAESVVLE